MDRRRPTVRPTSHQPLHMQPMLSPRWRIPPASSHRPVSRMYAWPITHRSPPVTLRYGSTPGRCRWARPRLLGERRVRRHQTMWDTLHILVRHIRALAERPSNLPSRGNASCLIMARCTGPNPGHPRTWSWDLKVDTRPVHGRHNLEVHPTRYRASSPQQTTSLKPAWKIVLRSIWLPTMTYVHILLLARLQLVKSHRTKDTQTRLAQPCHAEGWRSLALTPGTISSPQQNKGSTQSHQ